MIKQEQQNSRSEKKAIFFGGKNFSRLNLYIFSIVMYLTVTVQLLAVATVPSGNDGGISGKSFSIRYQKNNIVVYDKEGKAVFGIGRVFLFYSSVSAQPVGAKKLAGNMLRVDYKIDNDPSGKLKASSRCRLTDDKIIIDYEIVVPPELQKRIAGMSQEFVPYNKSRICGVFKNGIWSRPETGIPYEKRGVYMKSIESEAIDFYIPITGNHYYSRGRRSAMLLRQGKGSIRRDTLEIYGFSNLTKFEAAARIDKKSFALHLSTAKRFNIFESGRPEFKLTISNSEKESRNDVALTVKAYDYDGKLLLDEQRILNFKSEERKIFNYSLPEEKRNIYFIEASVKNGGKEYFTRTNVAILPAHKYTAPEHSRLGISGDFKIYDDPELVKLLKRIGVRYNRSGDNSKTSPLGIISFFHAHVKPSPYNPKADHKKIVKFVDRLQKTKAPWFEFCNEWSGGGDARYDNRKKRLYADYYLQWLRALRHEIAKRGLKVKIMSVAIGGAGADTKFVDYLHDNGAWKLLDGVAFHPGRGNCVPDLTGNGWRYLGSLRNMNAKIKEYGGKPLFLTEAYASTQANNSWCDSYRRATENILLTLMLGYAENAQVIFIYKWNEGISYDVNGINEKNREWNFGIMMRDGSPKPSMMGYAAAAEALDGAVFKRYLVMSKVRGMEFLTPRGKMSVLYDRTDGYWAKAPKNKPAHLEPWNNHWKTLNRYIFETSKPEVKVVDSIGREKVIPSVDGKVSLTLSGAPIIVYGLDIPENKTIAVSGKSGTIRYCNGRLSFLRNFDAKEIYGFEELRFAWEKPVAYPVSVEKIDSQTLKIDYLIKNNVNPPAMVSSVAKLTDKGMTLRYNIVPGACRKIHGMMQKVILPNGVKTLKVMASPERSGHKCRPFEYGESRYSIVLPGNPGWHGKYSEHLGHLVKQPDGTFGNQFEIVISSKKTGGN